MGWRAKAGREEKVLASIVMRLFSLADMAERSVRDLPWVRWCVLWAAWQANAVLRDYVEGPSRDPAGRLRSLVPMPAGFGTHPADAQDLAASLRAFAHFMQGMAAHLCRLSFLQRGQASDEAGNEGGVSYGLLERLAYATVSPVELRDTS